MRKRNFYGTRDRNVTPYHMTVEDNIIPELVAELERERAIMPRRRDEIAAFNAASPWIKRGLALTPVKFGISFTLTHMNQAGALVHVYTDGSVQLNHGGTEMGQGLYVKVAQVVAEEFGIGLDRVEDHRDDDGESAEHLADRGLVRQRPERQGGAGGGAHDPRAHGRRRRRGVRRGAAARSCSPTAWCAPAAKK